MDASEETPSSTSCAGGTLAFSIGISLALVLDSNLAMPGSGSMSNRHSLYRLNTAFLMQKVGNIVVARHKYRLRVGTLYIVDPGQVFVCILAKYESISCCPGSYEQGQ